MIVQRAHKHMTYEVVCPGGIPRRIRMVALPQALECLLREDQLGAA